MQTFILCCKIRCTYAETASKFKSSYIASYKEFRVDKDTFIQIFPNNENFGISFSTAAIYSRL